MTAPDYFDEPIGRCPDCGFCWGMCLCHWTDEDTDRPLTVREVALLCERFGFPHPK